LSKKCRQYAVNILAVITYLIIHEGTHIIQALAHGIFQGLKFSIMGVEVLITQPLTIGGWKLACFSGLSSLVTVGTGYVIYKMTPAILVAGNQFIKSYFYYTALVFLILDPLYISIFSFFVGGDINGISVGLGVPYMLIKGIYFAVLVLNVMLAIKKLYPKYTQDYKSRA